MRVHFYPPISVHCWGGLGSQLFTLLLVNKLTIKFPKRRIKIVFHSGGVTKRLPEILPLVENYSSEIIDDFKFEARGIRGPKSQRSIVRSLLHNFSSSFAKKFLYTSGFLSSCNNNGELIRTKPWVLWVRGHYSFLQVDQGFVDQVYRDAFEMFIKPNSQLNNIQNSLCIHYRLGDLISLGSKAPTSPLRLSSVLNRVNFGLPVLILSDSPEIAAQRLTGIDTQNEFSSAETSPWDAILQSMNAQIFIGTSSKISYWISILRVYLTDSVNTYMPMEDRNQLMLNLSKENLGKVKFYEA